MVVGVTVLWMVDVFVTGAWVLVAIMIVVGVDNERQEHAAVRALEA